MNKQTKIIGILLLVLVVMLGGVYFYQRNFFTTHFLPKTYANNTDISELTVAQAEKKMLERNKSQVYEIKEGKEVIETLPKESLGIHYDFRDDLKKAMKQQKPSRWFLDSRQKKQLILTNHNLNEQELQTQLNQLKEKLDKINEERQPAQNASIEKTEAGFEIKPEVKGTAIDTEEVMAALTKSIQAGESTLDVSHFVHQPTVKANDPKLKEKLTQLEKISNQTVSYTLSGEKIDVPKETVTSWFIYNPESQEIDIDQEATKAYLASLGQKYNTSTNPTKFKSTKRGEVTVPAGTYSWTLAVDTEAAALREDLLAGNSVNRVPAFQGSAPAGAPLIGNTYIEIDMSNQHMYFYKNGKLELETDIVSGKPTTPTPHGVFYVWDKVKDTTLRGTNDDGSKYASPVDYWMPIDWTGVGIHDSPWQPAYGGKLWETIGSHGCINTPPSLAGNLFNAVEVGTPVLVF
ncbi:L,D-transpeptidase family protein [Vagococcus lutrae]|uniref:L,D-TPase catalytic domain-containing protein n=1 Tax=Vagococcus lutrae LBD1 TaxID=1408226 RepID=V6QDR3_9ENTE|nr:L,D-transpeptidase family protein [Vagococcus lutrae]EST90718.1 hypothetical protein T233_00156 [Vagococcus lutrae LBD1]NKZ26727.1 L,D-transpeptidase family protein [Vagococcus lutrae]